MEQGWAAEAQEQFEIALSRGPKRVRARSGQLVAVRQLGNTQEATEIETLLKEILDGPAES